ncbi:preprotein translocase subunit SecE [Candidatus Uhrbacteria bacterium]|nr:preprotein translocase subunit SecE [Candidatus Uhrbacteria bacterium]
MNAQAIKESVFSYFRESYAELKRVAWPSKGILIQHTTAVIVFSLAVALFLGALDILFVYAIEKLILNK